MDAKESSVVIVESAVALIRARFGTRRMYSGLEVCRRCGRNAWAHDPVHCPGGIQLGDGVSYGPYTWDPDLTEDRRALTKDA